MKSFQPHCHLHPISLPVLHSYFTHILWVPLQLFLSQSYPDILSPKYDINFTLPMLFQRIYLSSRPFLPIHNTTYLHTEVVNSPPNTEKDRCYA